MNCTGYNPVQGSSVFYSLIDFSAFDVCVGFALFLVTRHCRNAMCSRSPAVEGERPEGWELNSEISRYRESRARRGRPAQSFQRPSRKMMDQMRNRNLTDVVPAGVSPGKGEGMGGVSRGGHTEAVFPLPIQSEEKIGADKLGELAELIQFNPESTMMVSLHPCLFPALPYSTVLHVVLLSLIRAHHLTKTQRNGRSSIP